MRRRYRVLIWLLLPVLGCGLFASAQARPAPIGQDPIQPGQTYAGDFPDPSVLRVGATYYAYSTTSDDINVPVLFSTNLSTWRAVPGSATNPTGDGLPRAPAWSAGAERPDGRRVATTWAPHVTKLRSGRYLMAYTTELVGSRGRMCISVATSTRPTGPFVDSSPRPLICPARGAIDPQIWLSPTGRPWLYWKVDRFPTQIYVNAMGPNGVTLAPGEQRRLLAAKGGWEGNLVENPAMIRYKGRYYLFYSANSYASSRYAVGYAICKTWNSGCKRVRKSPLVKSNKYIAGPGGASPFVDAQGPLRLAYHAWRAGAVGYPSSAACKQSAQGCGQRRLYVATLKAAKDGRLGVVRLNG